MGKLVAVIAGRHNLNDRGAILANWVQGLMVNGAKYAILIVAMARFAGQDRTPPA